MAVPAEFQPSVDYLREFGAAATTDVFDNRTYWDDDQLYAILNKYIVHNKRGLIPVDHACTVYQSANYPDSWHLRETTEIRVGQSVASPTYDPTLRTFTFSSTPSVTPIWYANFFNMNEALADLWEAKAAMRYELIRVRGGANTLYMEQEYDHCVAKAHYYRNRIIKRFKR